MPDAACGTPPTAVTTCKMNGYGLGYCDPNVTFSNGLTYNGFSDGTGWYD